MIKIAAIFYIVKSSAFLFVGCGVSNKTENSVGTSYYSRKETERIVTPRYWGTIVSTEDEYREKYGEYTTANDIGLRVCVNKAKGRPKPRKYGQFISINVIRLCNSHHIFNHLYSKEYNEFKRHIGMH